MSMTKPNSLQILHTVPGSTVSRSVSSKLQELVSVKDFGAVGDGVTDDTAAIQLAIDYLISRGGGSLYFPDTTSFYKVTSTLNIPSTADSFTLRGDGLWNSEIKMVTASADTLFTTAGRIYVKDMAITATPSSGDVYRANDIAFDSAGIIFMQSVALYGWDKGIEWSGGYYYKFFDCDFRLMNIVLNGFTANNVMVDKCKISQINKFAVLNGGGGPFVVSQCALEQWTQTLIGTSGGAMPLIVFKNNYVENYPESTVAAGLVGTYYNNGWVLINAGDTVLDSNFISCKGVRRIVDTGGTARSIKSTKNYILYQSATATTDYLFQVGTVKTLIVQDYAEGSLPAGTGSYTTAAWGTVNITYPESSTVVNPITLLDETPENAWAAMTLANGWANQDTTNYQAAGYQKIGNRVYLRGYITGTAATSSTIATLPSGFRPTTKVYRGLSSNTLSTTPVAITIRIASTGALIISNSPYTFGFISLDGMSFDID